MNRFLVFAGVCLLSLCTSLPAQTERGNITGLVTDGSGAGVPNQEVVIVNTANNAVLHLTADLSVRRCCSRERTR